MGVGAWTFYNKAKKHLADGAIDLDTNTFRMTLHTSASNAATLTLDAYGSLTGEVTEANGYSSSGKALAAVSWTAGSSAKSMRWKATATKWSAAGGSIANVKFAVIWQALTAPNKKLLMFSQLSTGQFSVTTGNSLTITPAATGIFELT